MRCVSCFVPLIGSNVTRVNGNTLCGETNCINKYLFETHTIGLPLLKDFKETNLLKKLKGLQTARQYELDKSKRYKIALEKIAKYEMYPYSDEVIEIKQIVLEALNHEI